MNLTHLHIIIVHFAVVLVPTAAVLLALGMLKGNRTISRLAYGIFIFASAVGVAAYFLGEEAEEAVENLSGMSKSLIENHAESGEMALWFVIVLGVSAIFAYLSDLFGRSCARASAYATFVIALATAVVLGLTAQKGGMIRHPEAFTPEQISAAETAGAAHEKAEDGKSNPAN